MEQSLKPSIKLIFGRICSGKGSYLPDVRRIVVSDIVKRIVSSTNRDALQNSLHLDNQIGTTLINSIYIATMANEEHIVVDGIRQTTIVDRVLNMYPDAELIWLEVPVEERKRRYENRKDIKDVEPFEIADNKPIELECQKIFDTFRNKLTIINNYGINQES
jgi:hypothetical protein